MYVLVADTFSRDTILDSIHDFFFEKINGDKMTELEKLGTFLGKFVSDKQLQYGDSFSKSGEVLKQFYPDGIKPYQYADALAVVRIVDKLFRIAQRGEDGRDRGGESPYLDISGYGLLGTIKDGWKLEEPQQEDSKD